MTFPSVRKICPRSASTSRRGYTPDWIRRPSKPCTRQCAAITEQRWRDELTNFLFLPEKLKDLDQLLKETVAAFAGEAVYLAHLDTFNPFFQLIVRLKKRGQTKNSAAAFLKLLELARMGLEKLLGEETLHNDTQSEEEACHKLKQKLRRQVEHPFIDTPQRSTTRPGMLTAETTQKFVLRPYF